MYTYYPVILMKPESNSTYCYGVYKIIYIDAYKT